ncbi:EF-hand and coiled-coil domain-containing protein 1 [Aplochiton taeniatus]
MQRGAVILPAKPSPHAARKSEWLRSALAHHHCPDLGVENEIVVLATGIDQYIQEVFHHLAYPNQYDVVSAEDFKVLCAVLGLTGEKRKEYNKEGDNEDEEIGIFSGLPCEIGFKDFHSRLCGYFRLYAARHGTNERTERLPITEETEHVEREIRLRWPRVRRKKSVSFNLSIDQKGFRPLSNTAKGHIPATDPKTGPQAECELETAALRELVEDLRSALQGSDARCLALEVALRRERKRSHLLENHPDGTPSNTTTSPIQAVSSLLTPARLATSKEQKEKVTSTPAHRGRGRGVGGEGPVARRSAERQDARDPLLRELKLIRSSRDGQLEEAIRFNQRLEEELRWAYQEIGKLEAAESQLRRENASIRRRAEDAREALRQGLQKVRLIQEQAQSVPGLQGRVTQLEAELHEHRSQCTCRDDGNPRLNEPSVRTEHTGMEEMGMELKEKFEEVEGLRLEVQLIETERVRLSFLEEKLTHALTLLHQLRNKNVSHMTLGKILMDALDTGGQRGHGPATVLQVAEALCRVQMGQQLCPGAEEGSSG